MELFFELVWGFIKDNWIIVSGAVASLIAVIAVPAFRVIALKALQASILRIGKAIMSMLTAEALTRGAIWVLRKLAKKTVGTWDDELVEQLNEALHGKKMTITISTDKVKVKLGETTLTDPQIAENGTDVGVFLTSLYGSVTISDALVSLVGVWYTAHICRITEREIKTQKFGESSATFMEKEGLFLEEAMALDTTGTMRNYIASLKNKNISSLQIGF